MTLNLTKYHCEHWKCFSSITCMEQDLRIKNVLQW